MNILLMKQVNCRYNIARSHIRYLQGFRQLLFVFTIISLLYSCSSTKTSYNPNKKFSRQQLQQDYTLLKNILEKKHPSLYWYTAKDSMDMYFTRYYNAIEDSMTEQQFGCGHTSFAMCKAYNKWANNKRFPSFPLFLKVWNDTMVVTANLNRKDSVLKRGTLITGINTWSNKELIQKMFGYMTEDGMANNVNYTRLSGNFPYYHRNIFGYYKEYLVNYLDSNNREQRIRLPLYEPPSDTGKRIRRDSVERVPRENRGKATLLNMRQMIIDTAASTAVIALNTFSKGKLRRFFRESFRTIRKDKIQNVVLDLRSNGGGKMAYSTLLTKYLSRRPFKIADTSFAVAKNLKPYTKHIKGKFLNNLGLFFFTKRKADGKYHFGLWERKTFQLKKKNHFGGKLFVLTNGPTFSAATLVCNELKGQAGITLVGEETGGGWHGNSGIMIPDITLPITKMRVRLPLFRLVQSNHVPKDGRGVQPDLYISTSYEAIIKNYDKKMKVVMEMIRRKQEERSKK